MSLVTITQWLHFNVGGNTDCMLIDVALSKPHSTARVNTNKTGYLVSCAAPRGMTLLFTYKTQQDMVNMDGCPLMGQVGSVIQSQVT